MAVSSKPLAADHPASAQLGAEMQSGSPILSGWRVRRQQEWYEFPVHHMRGGTSTGLVIWTRLAPDELTLREELLRHLMGVPLAGQLAGNRQITGLGRGAATSNKVFFADIETGGDGALRLTSTLAQLAAQTSAIDWNVNCGNMSAAIPLWALDVGAIARPGADGDLHIDIHNSNTGVITTARMRFRPDGGLALETIPGVEGAYPGVDLFLHDPMGSKTGRLLPTGNRREDVLGHAVTCIDVAVPMVIIDAAGLGKTAREPIAELEADHGFMQELRRVWIEAGLRMGLRDKHGRLLDRDDLGRSETMPKVCIVGPPAGRGHLSVRYFTPQTAHASLAVSGACCIAAAALLPGSVAHQVAKNVPPPRRLDYGDDEIGIENPAGVLWATVVSRQGADHMQVRSVAYRRSAQLLLRGHVPIYAPSAPLRQWLESACEHAA